MCGVVGFLCAKSAEGESVLRDHAYRMATALSHRGPDRLGAWADHGSGIALGHARLAIQDLSDHGDQPMVSACGRFVIVFNGEIYNFQVVRQVLCELGSKFRGGSDTEVLLEAISRWGIDEAILKLDGMFAFAIWDKAKAELTLGRDRIGKKPLYYGWLSGVFYFSSEIRGLRAHPEFRAEIDTDAVGLFCRFACVPAPFCILEGVNKLEAGHLLKTSVRTQAARVYPYWSLGAIAKEGESRPFVMPNRDFEESLDRVVRGAVERRMVADVPVGAFLSGGIDSSLVTSVMQSLSGSKVKTFSIGYEDERHNEAPFARAIAEHLGTDHHELIVSAQAAMDVIPALPHIYDEPFADASQIPTTLVSRLAREHVTVALSGDGGDEQFCGYDRYFKALERWGEIQQMPAALRRGLLSAAAQMSKWLPPNEHLQRYISDLGSDGPVSLFAARSERTHILDALMPGVRPMQTVYTDPSCRGLVSEPLNQMMYLDTIGWLPDDILVKMDRASMSASLEVRSPLLDTEVLDFAWRVPLGLKIRDGKRKWLLRQVLKRYIPEQLFEREKRGFSVPIARWLRSELRGWAEDLLDEQRLRDQGFFNAELVRTLWARHLKGSNRHRTLLWNILMFQAWLGAWS